MNILILNGSPKGEYSITWQTMLYLELLNPRQTFRTLHVGQRIAAFERDFSEASEALLWADMIVFSYPVYTFIAPCQMHRFIELMKWHGVQVQGKFATQITTSKHFYDVTAHRYIQENAQEMGMRFIRGLSADMDDLTIEAGQREAEAFWKHACWCVENGYDEPKRTLTKAGERAMVTVPAALEKNEEGDVVIVTDLIDGETDQLKTMIERFQAVLPMKSRVVNLRTYPFKGGCLGCFHCATNGECIYRDGFADFLRNDIQRAHAIIYAFTIRDHSMGARFKMYDDRQFCNGHRTVTMGMPVGYLISGDYASEPNVQMIVEARSEVGGNTLIGVATDEADPDRQIDQLSASLVYALKERYAYPQNFYGVGGMKIFRDLIYQMRGMMKADHRFYKAHGQYDFPQKRVGTVLKMYLVGALLSSPKVRAKIGNQMNEGMIAPYKKALKQAKERAALLQSDKEEKNGNIQN